MYEVKELVIVAQQPRDGKFKIKRKTEQTVNELLVYF